MPAGFCQAWTKTSSSNHLRSLWCRWNASNPQAFLLPELHWQNQELGKDLRRTGFEKSPTNVYSVLAAVRTTVPKLWALRKGSSEQDRLDRACPVYIHGDEGTYYKKSAVMILQWQGVLGKGTVKKQVAQHGVNSIGHTLRTRLLCGVMIKETCSTLFQDFYLLVCVLPCE